MAFASLKTLLLLLLIIVFISLADGTISRGKKGDRRGGYRRNAVPTRNVYGRSAVQMMCSCPCSAGLSSSAARSYGDSQFQQVSSYGAGQAMRYKIQQTSSSGPTQTANYMIATYV